mgnify:CR=1 FL=1
METECRLLKISYWDFIKLKNQWIMWHAMKDIEMNCEVLVMDQALSVETCIISSRMMIVITEADEELINAKLVQ